MGEPARFELDPSPVPMRRRGGVAATAWTVALLLVAGAAFLGRPSDGPPPPTRTIAAAVPSAGAAAPSWFHVEMTPRLGIELAPSTHSAPLRVPWDWSPAQGKKRAAALEQAMHADSLGGFPVRLPNGRMLVK